MSGDEPLGIVCALPSEARAFADLKAGELRAVGPHLLVGCSGIGPGRARTAAARLVAEGVRGLVSFGMAGGLARDLEAGAVVLPDRVVEPDSHEQPGRAWACAPALTDHLLRRLGELGVQTGRGTLLTTSYVIRSVEEKATLNALPSRPCLVDMESAAIAAIAAAAPATAAAGHDGGLPFCAVRVVVDPANLSMPVSALVALDPEGRFQPWSFAAAAATHPADLPRLVRLAASSRRAHGSLRRAAAALQHPVAATASPAARRGA